jgi:radical SAM superfamily enzyme YgiQ (UPF0313 family)
MKSKSKKLRIFLCDLTYDTILLVSDTIPINIGFIASYINKYLSKDIEISLFKYPQNTIEAIKKNPPDMIALSNYSWNSNLSEFVSSIAKKYNPNVITSQGGTNFPHSVELQKDFVKTKKNTDIFTILEGEKSTLNLVQLILECNLDRKKIFEKPIDGCVFIHPDTKNLSDDKQLFVVGETLTRIKDLDEIPSPYLNGTLDKFFDGKLTPFLETNRGCPFTCSFCHTGNDYYHKLNKFSSERIKDEISYIGKKAGYLGITNLHFADVNFGMYTQDAKVCEWLMESKKIYGWPLQVMATTGKNAKERIMEVTNILDPGMLNLNMSAQSMDGNVLENIKRSNIKVTVMKEINEELRKKGRTTKSELIMPLPGETKKTFLNGINDLLNSNVGSLTIYTLMMLHGTEFQNPKFRENWGYKGKYRIVPLNFGEYENTRIFDYEEAGIATKDMPFDDYIYIRSIVLMVESLINGRPFDEIFQFAKTLGLKKAYFLQLLRDNINKAPDNIKILFDEFVKDTKAELWDSEEELLNHYRSDDNFELLKQGKVGGNLIYKYKSKSLVLLKNEWIEYMQYQLKEFALAKYNDLYFNDDMESQIEELCLFCKYKLNGVLDGQVNSIPQINNFKYDILSWIDRDDENLKIANFRLKKPITYSFEFSKDQKTNRTDLFKRYGTDINSLSKIVTRISNLESQFRKIRTIEDNFLRDIYRDLQGENFVRYALVN